MAAATTPSFGDLVLQESRPYTSTGPGICKNHDRKHLCGSLERLILLLGVTHILG